MARKLDSILVVDVEATCWQGPPPPGELNEIIEIGIAVLDAGSLGRGARESILVKPERSRVSSFCTSLTTLTQDDVDRGVTFKDACARIRSRYGAGDRTWASYGDYDRRQFERQCREAGQPSPFGPTHINVKNLAALALGLDREVGMGEMLRLLGMELEGTHHRGGDDAWNIAGILAALLGRLRRGEEA